jgi:hypothetical protein
MNWFPMNMASRTGWPFIWLRRIQIIKLDKSVEYKYEILPLVREGADENGNGGYWRGPSRSIPDSDVLMSRGWWSYYLPINPDGTVKLPDDFYPAKLPGQEYDKI